MSGSHYHLDPVLTSRLQLVDRVLLHEHPEAAAEQDDEGGQEAQRDVELGLHVHGEAGEGGRTGGSQTGAALT